MKLSIRTIMHWIALQELNHRKRHLRYVEAYLKSERENLARLEVWARHSKQDLYQDEIMLNLRYRKVQKQYT